MRLLRQIFASVTWVQSFRALGAFLREALVWSAAVTVLEAFGRVDTYDGAALLGLTLALGMGFVMHRMAARGWMPATRAAGARIAAGARRVGQTLPARHAVILRPPAPGHRVRPDTSLLLPGALLAVATVGVLLLGGEILHGLALLKKHVSYTLYLLGLGTLWTLLGGTMLLGILASAEGLRRRGSRRPPLLLLLLAWIVASGAAALLPGVAFLGAIAAIGAVQAIRLRARPAASYLLSRRDGSGRLRVVPVHAYLRRTHAVLLLGLLFVAALAQAPHLWGPGLTPDKEFLLTHGLALVSSVAAVFLAARTGRHFARLLGPAREMPEFPLTPTLWFRQEGGGEPWTRDARRRGWRVESSKRPPDDGFDLVVGDASDPRVFHPAEGLDAEEAHFRLERRFHVVKRRQFWRRFHSLFKDVTSQPHETGSGYLFCPHVWLVQGIVRDAEESGDGEKPGGAILSQGHLGRPYSEVFSGRLRRYLGSVLRTLRIDMVYWEDAVGWSDLRAVLGVAFEVYDQGRAPLLERHFVGVPRVRVVIQEEDDSTPGVPPAPDEPPSVHARILLILRDRGGEDQETSATPPSNRVPEPAIG